MTAKKFFWIALFIGFQAFVIQIIDQLLCGFVPPVGNKGFGWIAFQAWAMYFMSGCTVKGGVRAFIGYAAGIVASIAIIYLGGIQLTPVLGFWAVPLVLLVLVPVILYLDIAPELFNNVPAVFVGAGVFFGFMNYVPDASFSAAAITEIIYCVLGLIFGYVTVTFRGWYEGKYVKK